MTDMAALAGEAVEAMSAGHALGLAILKAEMAALAQLMPGAETQADSRVKDARRTAEEAEVEAGFDNMPV